VGALLVGAFVGALLVGTGVGGALRVGSNTSMEHLLRPRPNSSESHMS
jgi:hypothetical protein